MMTAAYPRDFSARNNLGVVLIGQGLFDEALKAYTVANEIASDEPLPISNSAYALLFLGRYDEAFAMADLALAVRPDPGLTVTCWMVARIHGHARTAEFEQRARALAQPTQLLFAESTLAVWDGRLKDFSRIMEQVRAQLRAGGGASAIQGVDAAETMTLAVLQKREWLPRLKAFARQTLPQQGVAQIAAALATAGDMATVRSLVPQLDKADLDDSQQAQPVLVTRALLAGADGRAKDAAAMIDTYLAQRPRSLELHYYLGLAHERDGQIDDAIAICRRTAQALKLLGPSREVMGARLALALLLKQNGDTVGAGQLFDTLAKQWANADADFKPLKTLQKNR